LIQEEKNLSIHISKEIEFVIENVLKKKAQVQNLLVNSLDEDLIKISCKLFGKHSHYFFQALFCTKVAQR
jgi:hypothetical protein